MAKSLPSRSTKHRLVISQPFVRSCIWWANSNTRTLRGSILAGNKLSTSPKRARKLIVLPSFSSTSREVLSLISLAILVGSLPKSAEHTSSCWSMRSITYTARGSSTEILNSKTLCWTKHSTYKSLTLVSPRTIIKEYSTKGWELMDTWLHRSTQETIKDQDPTYLQLEFCSSIYTIEKCHSQWPLNRIIITTLYQLENFSNSGNTTKLNEEMYWLSRNSKTWWSTCCYLTLLIGTQWSRWEPTAGPQEPLPRPKKSSKNSARENKELRLAKKESVKNSWGKMREWLSSIR